MKQIMLQGFYRKLLFSLGLALLALLPRQARAVETNTLVKTFEEIARTNRHLSHTVIIENHALERRMSYAGKEDEARFRSWAIDQLVLLKHLQGFSLQRDEIIGLLKHSNPKVRTLALGALFQRKDRQDFPKLASLLEDRERTFSDLSDYTGSTASFGFSGDQESAQSVADIASAMLTFWGAPHGDKIENGKWLVTKETYAEWAKAGFPKPPAPPNIPELEPYSPDDGFDPDLALYQADTKRVLADLQSLPVNAKAWMTFHVYHSRFNTYFDEDALRQATLSAFRELNHDEIVRILKGQPGDQLPEIRPAFSDSFKDNPPKARFFRQIERRTKEMFSLDALQDFILQEGRELLRPEDVPYLLAREQTAGAYRSALWRVAAVDVAYGRSPDEAKRMIKEGMKRYSPDNSDGAANQAWLQAALWRNEGMKAATELVDWFYTVPSSALGPYYFLNLVDRDERADMHKLLAAIVNDKRFDRVDSSALGTLLEIVNRDLSTPLVPPKEILHSRKNPGALAEWRDLLRHYDFGKVQPPVTK